MAPFSDYLSSSTDGAGHNLAIMREDQQVSKRNGGASMPAPDASSAASTTSPSIYLGLGLGVGGAILIAVIALIVQIAKKRKQHRRMMETLEVEQAVQVARTQEIREVPRPASPARCSSLISIHGRAGWDALASNEAIDESVPGNKRKRSSVSLLKKHFKQGGIPLKRLKRLTAILESPRSRTLASPAAPSGKSPEGPECARQGITTPANPKAYTLRKVDDEDVFLCPDSPKLEVLPSFAIRSPGRYGAGIANNDNSKAARSRSVGALVIPIPINAMLGHTSRLSRPPMHARSISLGAPLSRPPSGPVPPLPASAPHTATSNSAARQGLCVSRQSSSSQESTSSSVLVTSPILKMHEREKAVSSPRVEELVAGDDSASLQMVSTRQWQSPKVGSSTIPTELPRTIAGADRDGIKSQVSIRSNIARYSVESLSSHRLSSASTASSYSQDNRLSIPHVGLADQVSMSRVSSTNSIGSCTSIRKITTPKKPRRTSVSAYGSPAERKKTSVLRDISANSVTPSRQASNATEGSGRSSNGNPFQWDNQPLPKPSALKGSPNARKGHRRQNCVRISTLTPQILGPPPSRPTSPSIMHGIEEESGEGEEVADPKKLGFVSNQRPASASSFTTNLRIQTLRASLTPSSPTLSAWTAYQEHGLPSQNSDPQLSASPATRTASRQSDRSSAFSIPSFPSPVKATISNVQLSQPVPKFYLSRPSTDIEENESSSPSALQLPSDLDVPSSPPLPVSKTEEYDPAHPAWPVLSIPAPKTMEYDPASPAWDDTEPERSSTFLPFALNRMADCDSEEVSPRSRPTSYGGDLPDTPPISPKTMPEGFTTFFDKPNYKSERACGSENLTSANASAIMARLPSRNVDFPGAPILSPPEESEGWKMQMPARSVRHRAVSNAAYLQPSRPAPSPPVSRNPSDIPSPLQVNGGRTSPRGPRTQPAQSVLKNAMALRRMNSEVNDFPSHRESGKYVHLGREASPLLPWIGSPDPNELYGDGNELFDFGFASGGAEPDTEEQGSAMDEIDMAEVERRLDGAIAGFEALPGDRTAQQERQSSVWEDGEKYWEQQPEPIESTMSSPLPSGGLTTPIKKSGMDSVELLAARRSIQMTPKSLYDSDGFLRT